MKSRCLMCGRLIDSTRAKLCAQAKCRKRWQRFAAWFDAQPVTYRDAMLSPSITWGFEQMMVDWLSRPGARLRRGELRTQLKKWKRDLRNKKPTLEFTFERPPAWTNNHQATPTAQSSL